MPISLRDLVVAWAVIGLIIAGVIYFKRRRKNGGWHFLVVVLLLMGVGHIVEALLP